MHRADNGVSLPGEVAVARVEKNADRVVAVIGHGQVGPAVAVDITQSD